MRHAVPLGFVAVPLVLFVGTVLATSAASRHGEGERVELELAGVLPMPDGPAGVVVLREKGKGTILPILVPDGSRFAHGSARASGLLRDAIEALGARIAEVVIDDVDETAFGACVRLSRGGERLEVRASPSESVALALAAGVPIVTTRTLLDAEGLTPDEIARVHARTPDAVELRL